MAETPHPCCVQDCKSSNGDIELQSKTCVSPVLLKQRKQAIVAADVIKNQNRRVVLEVNCQTDFKKELVS